MLTIEEIRKVRLAQLVREHGSLAKLNRLLELNARDSTLSQIANASPASRTGAPKSMGSAMARRLETACKKPTGWMDHEAEDAEAIEAGPSPAEDLPPSLAVALPVVLDAIAAAPDRARLRTALLALLEDDAPAYRQRIAELLSSPTYEPSKQVRAA